MQYILSIIVAFLLASAQALWRVVAQEEGVTASNLMKVIISPYFVGGAVLYVIATVIYLYLQSKYLFTHVQTVLLASSLLISFIYASVFFSQKISIVNMAGFVVLLIGIVLVVQR